MRCYISKASESYTGKVVQPFHNEGRLHSAANNCHDLPISKRKKKWQTHFLLGSLRPQWDMGKKHLLIMNHVNYSSVGVPSIANVVYNDHR